MMMVARAIFDYDGLMSGVRKGRSESRGGYRMKGALEEVNIIGLRE